MWPASSLLEAAWGLAVVLTAGWLGGSFLNQLVDRSPRHPSPPGTLPGPPPGVSWRRPARSVCFGCGVRIPWHDNLPVFSWLWLRGRCRRCGTSIGWRTLAVEVGTPCLWGAVYALVWGLAVLSWGLLLALLCQARRRVHGSLWGVGAVLLALGAVLAWG